jgi:hypothetical protein
MMKTKLNNIICMTACLVMAGLMTACQLQNTEPTQTSFPTTTSAEIISPADNGWISIGSEGGNIDALAINQATSYPTYARTMEMVYLPFSGQSRASAEAVVRRQNVRGLLEILTVLACWITTLTH